VFPVAQRHGKTAHLDVSGRRGEAIRTALRDQLGVEAKEIAPFGLGGSGGSTPMRITLDDGRVVFAKLYATNHLRADRWYKLGRMVMYGALEDERSFNSVRRMVEYEDYMLRYLRDSDVPTAEPLGLVELTPEREYMVVTGFIEGGREILDAEVGEPTIRSGVRLVRLLWDAGVAHRDVKPSNLLARDDGEIVLIDVFFCQVRPSPWRQSVDLANMMLTLALRSDAETVFRVALEEGFSADEVAEAFAATKGVTMPSQLRTELKRDGRDLNEAFRKLAPRREPVAIQRWTVRRLAYVAAMAAGVVVALSMTMQNLQRAGFKP
jgi:tRNA A-37 threonylcarbamoyl transferase component Bud32